MTVLIVAAVVLWCAWLAFVLATGRTILTFSFCNFCIAAIIMWHK